MDSSPIIFKDYKVSESKLKTRDRNFNYNEDEETGNDQNFGNFLREKLALF